jgi:hypothetical protein
MSTAALLVEIAEDLFDFGCMSTGRHHPGDPEPIVHVFARPKGNPQQVRRLEDIRPDIAAVFEAQHGRPPSARQLGDAMTVLEGKARQAEPTAASSGLLGMLAGPGSKATQLVKIARERYRFGVTTSGDPFAVPLDGPNIARPLRGGRRSLRAELARVFYEEAKTAPSAQALADALNVLQGEAQATEPAETALRAGQSATGDLVLDLGREDGQVAVTGPRGWHVTAVSPVLFWRTNATLPLPVPARGGSLDSLRALLNLADEDWPLALAWAVASLFPEVPHPVLLLRGEHGTAKSSAARLLSSLTDPCASQLRTAPRNIEDWCVGLAAGWITCLDNTSSLAPWLQDAICRAVTGDGLLRRELHTNNSVAVLAYRRVIAVTAIDPGPLAADLADRLLVMEPGRITDAARMPEADLAAAWRLAHPQALGALLDLAAEVLRVLPSVRRTGLPRMADFARVVLATDKVLGTDGFGRYAEMAAATSEHVADSDPVILAIRQRITGPWRGSAADCLKLLTPERPPRGWPDSPQAAGARLSRAAPVLRALGWQIDCDRTARKRTWTIVPSPEN